MSSKTKSWNFYKKLLNGKKPKMNYKISKTSDIENAIQKFYKSKLDISEITSVLDINRNLIKRDSKEYKKFIRLGYKVNNRQLTPPKTAIDLPYDGNYTKLFDLLKINTIKTVIANVIVEDSDIKQFYYKFSNINQLRYDLENLEHEVYEGQIHSFILLKGHKSNFGPSYDGTVNCIIELIDKHIEVNKIKTKIDINDLYNEFEYGVFEDDLPELSKRLNIIINVETLTNKIQYNETTNKKNKQLNIFIHNNHALEQNTSKKSKFINDVSNDSLNDYMNKYIDYKSIQNIITSDNAIVFIKTNDIEYRLKYINNIDLEQENCITDKQYYFNKCFKYFSKKPHNINSNDINIDIIKQIKSITINFSKSFQTKDCEIIDINSAYNNFGILPTDLSYFYDATNFTTDDHNKLLLKEGFGLIDTLKIGDITIGGWRGINMIRHIINKYKFPIKVKQYMISSNTTTFDIKKFMELDNYQKRRWHNVLGKMQSTTKTISTYSTDPIIGGNLKYTNGKYALYETAEKKDFIGKNFYPHICGYVHEYTNIKMLDKYVQLKKLKIDVYRGWVDGLYFDKSKKYLIPNEQNWSFEDTTFKPMDFVETIQKIKDEPLTNFSREININSEKFTAYIGGAGYGKSHKLKEIYRQNPSNTLILTPTVLLKKSYYASNVQTFQKFIYPHKKDYGFDKYKILLIDEYTMVTPNDFNKILQVAKNLTHCYVFGDTAQLLNIEHTTIDLTNFKIIELTTNYRQLCPIFQENLNITRKNGDISYIKQYINVKDAIKDNKFILSPTNKEINRINNIGFELNENKLQHGWKVNTPVVFEDERKDFCNGESGIITKIDDEFLYIQKNNEDKLILLKHSQSNLIKLYYSTTYHKCQGQTIKNKDIVINTKDFSKFSKSDMIRMLYVAASRVKNIKQLYVLKNII